MLKPRPLTKAQYDNLVQVRNILNTAKELYALHETDKAKIIIELVEAAYQADLNRVRLAQKVIRLPHYLDTGVAM